MEPFGKVLAATVLTASLTAVQPLFAQNGDNWYGGLSTGFWGVRESVGFRGALPKGFGLSASSEGLSAIRQFGGYRFSNSLSIEGAQTNFGLKGSDCNGEPHAGNGSIACLGSAWSVAGVATVPFESGVSLFGRFGLQLWQPGVLDDHSGQRGLADLGTVYGMGLRYGLSRSVTLHAETEFYGELYGTGSVGLRLTPGLFDASVHSIGLSVNF